MNRITEKYLSAQNKKGMIRGYQVQDRKKGYSADKQKIPREKPKAIIWLDWNLTYWANEHALTLRKEFKFAPGREFKSDYAIEAIRCLIEYEGGIFMQRGGHNSPAGIQRDIEKYSLAEKLGWKVIRIHALNYTTVLKTLNEMI